MTALFRDMPLTSGDLRDIADAVDAVDATTLAANKAIGRIEVHLPDCEQQIGWIARFDESDPDMGWGFTPEEFSGPVVNIGDEIRVEMAGTVQRMRLQRVSSNFGENVSAEFVGRAR